jgi:hypothetical protein
MKVAGASALNVAGAICVEAQAAGFTFHPRTVVGADFKCERRARSQSDQRTLVTRLYWRLPLAFLSRA